MKLLLFLSVFILSGFAGTVLPTWVYAEKRIALVIGNSDYANVPALTNPRNDASDIAAALGRLNFDVTLGLNYDDRSMRLALRDFAKEAETADVTFIYFAGHGIEIDKVNYLIPVNAELGRDRDVEFEAISLDTVLRAVEGAPGLRVVLVDACRNNPFVPAMTRTVASRSLGFGLGRIDPSRGVLVGYAAREGTLALDGEGRNSPYAQALLQHLEEPGLEIGKLFRKVRDTVYDITDGFQEPFTYGSLPGTDYYLKPPLPEPQDEQGISRHVSNPGLAAAFVKAEKSGTLWSWNKFLETHGDDTSNALVALALNRRDALQQEADELALERQREPWLKTDGQPRSGPIELTLEQRRLVQKALMYSGFYTGAIDGQFGPNTRRAISNARIQNNLIPGTYVDRSLLKVLPNVPKIDALKSDKARVLRDLDWPKNMEPRLQKAIKNLAHRPAVFGYYQGRLYVSYKTSGIESGWDSASRYARQMGGYLAVITDANENRFLYNLIAQDDAFFRTDSVGNVHGPAFGLYQLDGSPEPAGGWTWVTGEPFRYNNWSRGNPDNHMGRQKYGHFFGKPKSPRVSQRTPIFWDDGQSYRHAYIIEFE